jgi:hypothetical protein
VRLAPAGAEPDETEEPAAEVERPRRWFGDRR